jgi:hypothetical protein
LRYRRLVAAREQAVAEGHALLADVGLKQPCETDATHPRRQNMEYEAEVKALPETDRPFQFTTLGEPVERV